MRDRLGAKMTPRWRQELAAHLYRVLVEAGKRAPSLEAAADHLREAQELARDHGLDDLLSSTLLAQVGREQEFGRRLESLRARRAWPEVVTAVRAALQERPQQEWKL